MIPPLLADEPEGVFLDDGSDWFNLACTRIVAVMLAGIAAIVIVAEICRG